MNAEELEMVGQGLRELRDNLESRIAQILAENEYPKDAVRCFMDLAPGFGGKVALVALKSNGKTFRKPPDSVQFMVPVGGCKIRIRGDERDVKGAAADTDDVLQRELFIVGPELDLFQVEVLIPGLVLTCVRPPTTAASRDVGANRGDSESVGAVTLPLESVYLQYFGRSIPPRVQR